MCMPQLMELEQVAITNIPTLLCSLSGGGCRGINRITRTIILRYRRFKMKVTCTQGLNHKYNTVVVDVLLLSLLLLGSIFR